MADLDKKTKNIAKTFSEWLNTNIDKTRFEPKRLISKYLCNDQQRLEAMENIFISGAAKTNDITTFFENVYEVESNEINWQKNPEHEIKWNILETYFEGLGFSENRLENTIKLFFEKVNPKKNQILLIASTK